MRDPSSGSSPLIYGDRYVATPAQHSGGTGTVVVCTDPNLDRLVAIKFLQAGIDKKRVHDEISALQRIRSKHVVQIYDVVVHQPGNSIGIVQEYVDGSDLSLLARSFTTKEQFLLCLYQIATGLADIHEQGLIHRDIKPNNLRKNSEGIVKIIDFDLARKEGTNAKTMGFRGTLGYAAPELFSSGHVAFSNKVDVYAFGSTAIFLAKGTLPSELVSIPPNPSAWRSANKFSNVCPFLPISVSALVDGCLALSPDDRPTMDEIQSEISRHLLHESHRALLIDVSTGKTWVCAAGSRSVRLQRKDVGAEIEVRYDGLHFAVTSVEGDVFLNNNVVAKGTKVQGSCVITLGGSSLGSNRSFVTLDVSHPEVVL